MSLACHGWGYCVGAPVQGALCASAWDTGSLSPACWLGTDRSAQWGAVVCAVPEAHASLACRGRDYCVSAPVQGALVR